MKIVYCMDSLGNSGGVERVLCTKTNYFVEKMGYEVHIIVAEKRPTDLFFKFSDKIHFHFFNLSFPPRKPWNIFFRTKANRCYRYFLSKLLIEIRPNITVSLFGEEVHFLYRLKDGSKKVLEFHFTKNYLKYLGDSLINDRFRFFRKYWLSLLLKREEYWANKYDHIVLLTEKDKRLWGGGSKYKVIPNPLSFSAETSALLQKKRIVSMGRLVLPKGFQYLIRAFSLLVGDYPDWQVFIYGEGQDEKYLKELVNELSLQDNVVFKLPIQDVREEMMEASLLVLSSLYDGFGLVLIEAMVCGVPCVAFDCECGPSEIIKDKEDGFLVELKNVEKMADKMRVLMQYDALRFQMGAKAKENVAKFDVDKIMKLWDVYFTKIIETDE